MLDIRSYDLATLYRFKLFFDRCYWYNVPQLPITEIRNDKIYKGERIEFPLIALRRVATPIMYKDGQNSWANVITGDRRGRDISIAPDMTHSTADMTMVQSSYELRYMLDVFSFERDNFDELVVEIQENLFRYPYLTFENWKNKDLRMPDPQVSGMSTNITWESTEDNTDLEAFDTQTPFYRATITFTLRAYIYRKYAALLIEELLNGYRILDYKKVTQQVVDSDYPFTPNSDDGDEPGPDPEPPQPEPPTPTGTQLTTENVAELNALGSMGMFLYIEQGGVKFYGSEVDGKYLKPVSINAPINGEFSYTKYKGNLTGTWKLISVAKERTTIKPCIVFAVKVAESNSTNNSTNNTDNSTNNNSDDSSNTSSNSDIGNNNDSNSTGTINENNNEENNTDTGSSTNNSIIDNSSSGSSDISQNNSNDESILVIKKAYFNVNKTLEYCYGGDVILYDENGNTISAEYDALHPHLENYLFVSGYISENEKSDAIQVSYFSSDMFNHLLANVSLGYIHHIEYTDGTLTNSNAHQNNGITEIDNLDL